MTVEDPLYKSRLQAAADRVRTEGGLGRSELLIRLFDFLLEQSLANRSPKEIEIAQDVFGKTVGLDLFQDASVRVYIHRLRRKLQDFYVGGVSEMDRLSIPLGEYRLVIASRLPDELVEDEAVEPAVVRAQRFPKLEVGRLWIVIAFSLVAAALFGVGIAVWGKGRSLNPAVNTSFWSPLARDGMPTVVLTGDYYIFVETAVSMNVNRLVREFSINSRDDLDQYLMAHPKDIGHYIDLDLHYLPASTGPELMDILPVINDASAGRAEPPRVVPMSQLFPSAVKQVNVVYVGLLSGLGALRDPVFQASGFAVGSSYDELIDRKTGKHYISDGGDVSDGHKPKLDYSYLASLPGPVGNRILIVAGTRDAAAMQAAEIARDRHQLDQIAAAVGRGVAFEALYEVRTVGNLNLYSKLVLARPLNASRIWDPGLKPQQTFPDQLQADPVKDQVVRR